MDKEKTEPYTDYLICNQGLATATSLSAMLDSEVSYLCPRGYDPMTRHLSARLYTSKDLWVDVKPIVRHIEKDDACPVFDDTVQEKASTDENGIMCWHYGHCKGRLGFRHQPAGRAAPQWRGVHPCCLRSGAQAPPVLRHQNPQGQAGEGKHFISALKDNRWVALTETDKNEGRHVRAGQLGLADRQAVRGWMKGSGN